MPVGSIAGAIAVLIVLTVLLTLTFSNLRHEAPSPVTEHFSIIIPRLPSNYASFLPVLGISNDGSTIAFAGRNEDGIDQLFIRRRDREEIEAIGGMHGSHPTFSPDGQWISYGREDSIRKTLVRGGPITVIVEAVRTMGHAWLDDRIVYSTFDDGKTWIVSADGGTPEQFIADDALPDGAAGG